MRNDDIDFVRWASRRHSWLWSRGYGPRRYKSKAARQLAQRAAVALMRLDRLRWSLGFVR